MCEITLRQQQLKKWTKLVFLMPVNSLVWLLLLIISTFDVTLIKPLLMRKTGNYVCYRSLTATRNASRQISDHSRGGRDFITALPPTQPNSCLCKQSQVAVDHYPLHSTAVRGFRGQTSGGLDEDNSMKH